MVEDNYMRISPWWMYRVTQLRSVWKLATRPLVRFSQLSSNFQQHVGTWVGEPDYKASHIFTFYRLPVIIVVEQVGAFLDLRVSSQTWWRWTPSNHPTNNCKSLQMRCVRKKQQEPAISHSKLFLTGPLAVALIVMQIDAWESFRAFSAINYHQIHSDQIPYSWVVS